MCPFTRGIPYTKLQWELLSDMQSLMWQRTGQALLFLDPHTPWWAKPQWDLANKPPVSWTDPHLGSIYRKLVDYTLSLFLSALPHTQIQQNLIYWRDDWLAECAVSWGGVTPSTWDFLHLCPVHSPLWKSGSVWHAQGHLGSGWQWQEPNLIYPSVPGYWPASALLSVLRVISWPEMEKKYVLISLFIPT